MLFKDVVKEAIKENPGVSARQLTNILGEASSLVTGSLKYLIDLREINRKKGMCHLSERTVFKYYPNETKKSTKIRPKKIIIIKVYEVE